jgi:hypothetical protein
VSFQYTQLTQLREAVSAEPIPVTELTDRVPVTSACREYQTDIITLFHATGDFRYRAGWREGVKRVEEVDHLLPRVGMRFRCVLEDGAETIISSSSYHYHPDRIEFTETDEGTRSVTRFLLEKVADDRTRLTLEYYVMRSRAAEIMFRLRARKRFESMIERSLSNLVGLVKEIRI